MNKIIVTSIFILINGSMFGQYIVPRPIGLNVMDIKENPCDNKYCVIDFSEKYLLALNYITQNDSNLQFKKIKISERPNWTSYTTFFEFLDTEIQKKVFRIDTITDGRYGYVKKDIDFSFDNQRFQLPDSLYTSEAEITMFFSKILDNSLFVNYTSCLPELSHNYDYKFYVAFSLNLGCDDFNNLYYFKFKDNEIDEIYKWIKNESGNGKIVRLK